MSAPAGRFRVPRSRRIPPLRKGVYILPNLFTSAGLISGFYSIVATSRGNFWLAAVAILGAQLCDVLDGRIARLTRASSSFGTQYDSLSDLVAFGVAPSILVWHWALQPWGRWGWVAATLYVVCSALRLARFNVQVGTVERRHFIGLPTPAAAAVIAATVLVYFRFGGQGAAHKIVLMPLLITTLAALMVSEVRYFSFKEFQLHHRHPFPILLAVLAVVLFAVAEPEPVLFLVAFSYAASGPIGAIMRFLGRRRVRRRMQQSAPQGASGRDAGAVVRLDKPRIGG